MFVWWVLGLLVSGVGGLKCFHCIGRECKSGLCEGFWCKRGSLIDNGTLSLSA